MPSDDPLDKPDFDTIDYINNLFPTEQSLTNIDDVINSLECKVDSIDNDIRSVIRGQIEVNKVQYNLSMNSKQINVLLFFH